MRLSFRLAHLWIRSRPRQAISLLVGVAAAGLVLLYIILNAFSLSGAQLADRDLGNHEYQIGIVGSEPGNVTSTQSRILQELKDKGAKNVSIQLTSPDLAVDGARTTGLTTGLQTLVGYDEVPSGASVSNFIFHFGHAPANSHEVALSAALNQQLNHPSQITVFSGAATLEVVGVYLAPYTTDALQVYGGPGLWQSLPKKIQESFQASSLLAVSWDGLPLLEGAEVLSEISGTPVDSLMTGTLSRSVDLSVGQRSLTQRTPGLFNYPSLGLMALAGIAMAAMLMPPFGAETGALTKLGLPRRPIMTGILAAVASLVVAAVDVGGLCGAILGWLARLWVVPRLLTQPISPFPPLTELFVRLGLASLLPALACAVTMDAQRPIRRQHALAGKWLTAGRRIVAAGALAWCLYQLTAPNDIDDALILGIVMTLTALLALPDAVRLLVHIPLPRTVNGRISQRLVRTQTGRVITVAMLLCGCLALPSSLTVLVTSVQVSNAAKALIPKGQLSFESPSNAAVPASLLRTVERKADLSQPVPVSMLDTFVDGSASQCFGVMVVPTLDDLTRLNDGPIDPAAASVLTSGGLLDISGATSDLALTPDNAPPRRMPTAHMKFQSAWTERYAAVMLESTARSLKLDFHTNSHVYTGVTDAQIQLAKDAVFAAGADPRIVNYHVDPPPPEIPWQWWLAIGALSVIALFAIFVSTRSLGANLRQHSSKFLAIGLPPSTGRSVLATELGVLLATTVPLTLAVGILPTALVAAADMGLELVVPSSVLGLAAGVLVGAVAISGAGAMIGVTAKERRVDALV